MSQTMIMTFIEKVAEDLSKRNLQQMNNIRLSANAGRLLELKYKDKAGVITTRFVEPYKLTDTDFWGYDPDQDGIRRFKIKNIKGVKRSSKPFEARWPIEMNEPILKAAMATAVQKRYNEGALTRRDAYRAFEPVRHENPVHDRINSRAKRFEEMGDKATKNMDAAKYQRVSKTNNIRHAPAIDSKRMFRYIGNKSNEIINELRGRYGDDSVTVSKNGVYATTGETGFTFNYNNPKNTRYELNLPQLHTRTINTPDGPRIVSPLEAKSARAMTTGHEILGELTMVENLKNELAKRGLFTRDNIYSSSFGTHAGIKPLNVDSQISKMVPPSLVNARSYWRDSSGSGLYQNGKNISEFEIQRRMMDRLSARNIKFLASDNADDLIRATHRLMKINKSINGHTIPDDQMEEIARALFKRI